MRRYSEEEFKFCLSKSMEVAKRILDTTRNPQLPEDQDHTYEDKYALVESLTNTAEAATVNALGHLGVRPDTSFLMDAIQDNKAVTLRFTAEERSEFSHEQVVETPISKITKAVKKSRFNPLKKKNKKTDESSSEVIEEEEDRTEISSIEVKNVSRTFHWKVTVSYKIVAFVGSQPKDCILFQEDTFSRTIVTGGFRESPCPPIVIRDPIDLNLTWLLQQIKNGTSGFSIDRSLPSCRTPRRNDEIEAARTFFFDLNGWSEKCSSYFVSTLFGGPFRASASSDKLANAMGKNIFNPVLPLMESRKKRGGTTTPQNQIQPVAVGAMVPSSSSAEETSSVLNIEDVSLFLQEHERSLGAELEKFAKEHPDNSSVARLVLVWRHMEELVYQWSSSINYVEDLLFKQLSAAIGKEVKQQDFEEYMRFHNKRLLGDQYKPFCYDIRRPDHYPEGILSLESSSGSEAIPIETISRLIPGEDVPMRIPLNAATSVEFAGDFVLHAWIRHCFAGERENEYSIAARARPFSSFALLVGNISGPDEFTPKDAIVLQNKDEVMIPILLNSLPSAKDFKDAISSLSPEQRRFAESFRGMQLESSVFGVCVIQLKPQLEALLRLPPDALTKEIKLTQDLLSLFVEYQIPSDLLTFDGPVSATNKVDVVKGHVQAVLDVIETAKREQLDQEKQKAKMNLVQQGYLRTPERFGDEGSGFDSAIDDCFCYDEEAREECYGFGSFRGMCIEESAVMRSTPAPPPACIEESAVMRSTPAPPPAPPQEICLREPKLSARSMEASIAKKPKKKVSRRKPAHDYQAITVEGPHTLLTGDAVRLETPKDAGSHHPEEPNPIQEQGDSKTMDEAKMEGDLVVDFTAIPKKLDRIFEFFDTDNCMRTTTIKVGEEWKLRRPDSLLCKVAKESVLSGTEKRTEKEKAFDLLDALSRSGSLPIACGELHVIVGVSHHFLDSVVNTVVQANINPIEKAEKSIALVVAGLDNAAVPPGGVKAGES